jgi:hypothetical protein
MVDNTEREGRSKYQKANELMEYTKNNGPQTKTYGGYKGARE